MTELKIFNSKEFDEVCAIKNAVLYLKNLIF